MSLICELKLDIPECSRRFGIDFFITFHNELLAMRAMEEDGLLRMNAQEIQVSDRGRPFLRNICMLFDAYLESPRGDQPPPRFSATL
jgi:oxygen-independent coproporphyrinogen-3 oxidase